MIVMAIQKPLIERDKTMGMLSWARATLSESQIWLSLLLTIYWSSTNLPALRNHMKPLFV